MALIQLSEVVALQKVSSTAIRISHVGLLGEFFDRDEAEEVLKWLE